MTVQHFDVKSLAEYLHLRPEQVLKLVERGKIPGRKVGGQWRFSEAEIHRWLEERIGLADDAELASWESTFADSRHAESHCPPGLAHLLPKEAVAVPLEARTRDGVLRAMVDLAARTGWVWDAEGVREAVRAREALCPTAQDNGVALLHPRRPMPSVLERPFLALGRTLSGVPFGGSRSGLTDVFFLILSFNERQHLCTLARLSRLIGSEGFLEGLRAAEDSEAAWRWFINADKALD